MSEADYIEQQIVALATKFHTTREVARSLLEIEEDAAFDLDQSLKTAFSDILVTGINNE